MYFNINYILELAKDIRSFVIPIMGVGILTELGIIIYFVVSKKKIQQSLKYIDPITNYPNELKFIAMGRQLLENEENQYTVIHFKVDYRKQLDNDFSLKMKSLIIQSVGVILPTQLDDDEIFAYLGNEEFVILKHYTNQMHIVDMFQQLELQIHTILLSNQIQKKIKIKYGIRVIHEETIESAIEKAKFASSLIDEKSGTTHVFYNEMSKQQVLYEAKLEGMLEKALEEKEFEVYYQPKFDLKRYNMIGAEALVRWNSEMGMLMPDSFIPLFERTNSICRLDMYIFEEVCAAIRKWLSEGKNVSPISVNLSRNHIMYSPHFVEDLVSIVKKYRIPVHLIELELTESAFMENQSEIMYIMERLKRAGFRLSMDDFGSGYSSLNLLAQMPVDVVKIDKGFLTQKNPEGKERIIVGNVVQMVKELGLEVICEGVETNEQAKFLRDVGCDNAQGYLYSKPVPIHSFEEYMLHAS